MPPSDLRLARQMPRAADTAISRVSAGVLAIGTGAQGNFGGSLVSTGLNSDGGLLLQQFTTVVGTPTVTPATSGSTSYSYEVVALDINRQPIGVSAAGTTAAAASTITTTNFITVAWAAVAGAFAYAVYRSASGGTPSTTGLLSSSQTITAITTGTSTMVMTVASVAINTGIVGQLLTVSGSSHSNNNGSFYCTAATATSITVFNPYAVAEASPPASAAFIGGVVPASTLSFQDIGFAANSVAAPSTNTSGSLGFVASYESAASGTALSQDFWSIYPVVASGLNGASTLTFTHSGSSGTATVSVPNLELVGAIFYSSEITFYSGTPASNTLEFVIQTAQFRGSNLATIGFAAGAPNAAGADTAISRVSAGILGIGNGTAGDTSGNLSFNKVIKYAGVATVSAGVPSELATVDLTTQSAAITATTLYSVPAAGAGMYVIAWVAKITTKDAASSALGGTNGFQISFTSPTDSVVKTDSPTTPIISAANTTGTSISGCEVVYAKASTNIQYAFGYTSTTPGQMVYEFHCKCSYLG